jgi:hypothetical protein
MELDIFIPHLSLAFEYQGQHHYTDNYQSGVAKDVQQRDIQKASACLAAGITLIQVPYWWDKSSRFIEKLIFETRPDLGTNVVK